MALTRAQKRITLVFLLAGVSIAFFVSVAYQTMRSATDETRKVNIALQRLLAIENLLFNIQSIESSQRGYLITGNEVFLRDHHMAVDELDKRIQEFYANRNSLNDRQHLDSFVSLLRQKVIFSNTLLGLHAAHQIDSVQYHLREGQGHTIMKQIRDLSSRIEDSDRLILRDSNRERQKVGERNVLIFFAMAVIIYLLLYFNYRIIKREMMHTIVNETRLQEHDLLLSNIVEPIMTTDLNFSVTRWNKTVEELLGYSFEEVKGKVTYEFLDPEFPDSSVEDLREQLFGTGIWEGEVSLRHKDGSRVYIMSRVTLLKDANGNRIGAISVLRDITSRKKLEQQLKQLTEHLEDLVQKKVAELNMVYDRIADSVIAIDNNWNYTYMNQKAMETHKITNTEVLGKNMLELFPNLFGTPLYHGIKKAMSTKEAVKLEDYYSINGEWFESIIYPSEDGVSIYYHEITQRKIAEQQLEAAYEELDRHARELAIINERFHLVAKATNDAIWDYDMKQNVVWGNAAFSEYFNIPEGRSVSYETFLSHLHPDDRNRIDENMKIAIARKEHGIREEFRFLFHDGSFRIISDRAYIMYDEHGSPYRMLGAMQDITAQNEANYQLKQEKELFENLVNSLPGVFYHFDNSGKYLNWNKNLELVTGYTSEEVRTLSPLDFYKDAEKEIVLEKIRSVFSSKGSDQVEANLLLKNGKTIPYIFTGKMVIVNGEETLLGIGLDISEKVRSQEELARSEEKYRTLIEQASDGILISDNNGKYISVNTSAERLSGYSREALLDMSIPDLFFSNPGEPFSPEIDKLARGAVIRENRFLKRKDGIFIHVEISYKLLKDGRFQCIARDITDRVIAEQKLKKSHTELRQLASHLQTIREDERTHMAREIHDELGQQLTGLKMDMAWIKRKLADSLPEVTAKINETSLLIDDTVKTVRRLSAKLRPSILDDLGIIAAMEWHSEEFQKRSGIETLFTTNSPDLVLPMASATAIFRIYQESLTNVSRHADATKVEASLIAENGQVVLTITDNGKGFDVEEVNKKKTLGLLGMKERTLLLGGSYEISGNRNMGTSVVIRIPVVL